MRQFSPGTKVTWQSHGARLSGVLLEYDNNAALVYANGSTYQVAPDLLQRIRSRRGGYAGRGYARHNPNDVLRYIVRYKIAHDGNSPSIREICKAMDIPSTSSCNYILRYLQQAGQITIPGHGESRTIEIVGGYQNHPLGKAQ